MPLSACVFLRALTGAVAKSQIFQCQTAGWPLSALRWREESPGSTEVRCRVTPGGGDPRESATESTPPARLGNTGRAARVKRCGKSAPRRRQRRRQGKPHREQDQVGAAGIPASRECRADLRAAARVGRTRRSATGVPEEWPSPPGTAPRAGQNPAYTPSGALSLKNIYEHDSPYCVVSVRASYMMW